MDITEETTEAFGDMNSSNDANSKSSLNHTPVVGPPPPPRNDSLNVRSSVQCSPLPSAPQRHSSLDANQRESIASALTSVLKSTPTKELPDSPLSPPVINKTTSITQPQEKAFSPWSHDTRISVSAEKDTRPRPPMVKQSSLYISPRKLSVSSVPHMEDNLRRKTGQILKASGINSVDLSGSRSNLLEAIRKGIQLRKVNNVKAAQYFVYTNNINFCPSDTVHILFPRC